MTKRWMFLFVLIWITVSGIPAFAMTITLDLDTASKNELMMIRELINQKLGDVQDVEAVIEKVNVPNVVGMELEEAKLVFRNTGLAVEEKNAYSNTIEKGRIIATNPRAGLEIEKNQVISLTVSKGRKRTHATHSTWYAWWVKGSEGDWYEFVGSPYIEDETLYITLDATLKSQYKHKWRGYGTAAVTDTFDKVVPFFLEFENEEIVMKKPQRITLKIPLQDLDVEKPTTISTKIEMFYGNNDKQEALRMDFTFAW